MRSRRYVWLLTVAVCVGALFNASESQERGGGPTDARDMLYQVSTINALLAGLYDGSFPLQELARQGDFGLGTMDGLDGELLCFDGKFYNVLSSGRVVQLDPTDSQLLTPFASVTWFDSDSSLEVEGVESYEDLKSRLDGLRDGENYPYAFRVDGRFSHVTTRSVPKQEPPYPPLADVVDHQAVFDMADCEGTLVGFWLPEYTSGLNVPGYHLHFITRDRSAGGHLLECVMEMGTISADLTTALLIELPEDEGFEGTDLMGSTQEDLNKVEK